jgi:DNA-binding NarL/FixJ family response regulator
MIPDGEMAEVGVRREIKLLVIDDHSDHFELIQAFADMCSSQYAFECKLATDEHSAQELIDGWEPSVALVDVHLVASGLELIRALTHKGTAVIALSEARIPHLADTAQAYGALGCFTKSDNPDDIEVLLAYMASVAPLSVVSH